MDELKRPDWREAEAARVASTAGIGVELMRAWNRGKTDPSNLALMGHDTSTGYEFCIERDGVTYVCTVTRDLGS